MISVTLQDCVFPVAWFSMWMKCPIVLNMDNAISGSPLYIPFSRLFVLDLQLERLVYPLEIVFWVTVNLFSSIVFLAIASASLCVSRCSLPEAGSTRNCCIGSRK